MTEGFSSWQGANACMRLLDSAKIGYSYKFVNGWYYITIAKSPTR